MRKQWFKFAFVLGILVIIGYFVFSPVMEWYNGFSQYKQTSAILILTSACISGLIMGIIVGLNTKQSEFLKPDKLIAKLFIWEVFGLAISFIIITGFLFFVDRISGAIEIDIIHISSFSIIYLTTSSLVYLIKETMSKHHQPILDPV